MTLKDLLALQKWLNHEEMRNPNDDGARHFSHLINREVERIMEGEIDAHI